MKNQPGLPGLYVHSEQLTSLLKKKFSDLHELFEKKDIIPQLYLTEWLIPLGCYHVPLRETVSLASLGQLIQVYFRIWMGVFL